jgi:hypothetical protein
MRGLFVMSIMHSCIRLSGALGLALTACGGSNDASDASGQGSSGPGALDSRPVDVNTAERRRLICPQCVQRAGGETEDFGDGGDRLPLTGSGQSAEPSPCELSEVASEIDASTARTLGFGAEIDLLERSFEVDFRWSALELEQGDPAAGYATDTRLSGTLAVARIIHQVPSLAGCEDSLRVSLSTRLRAADGAFSVEGTLVTNDLERGDEHASADGLLDLGQAHGTLDIHPPEYAALSAFIVPRINIWPEDTRVSLKVAAMDPKDFGSDTPGYQYIPLEGRGPLDACATTALPRELDEPLPSVRGQSLADLLPLLSSLLVRTDQPASWLGGAQTTVTTELGTPFDICASATRVVYSVPYGVVSADGRVRIQRDAGAAVSHLGGPLEYASVQLHDTEMVSAERFAAQTGVSGVDFRAYAGGLLRASSNYAEAYAETAAVQHGSIAVEGADVDGSDVRRSNVTLDSLSW